MSDLISRQAAICAVEEYADRLQMVNWQENPGVPYKAHALNWVINTLRDLPSAERRGRWIRTGEDGYCSVCKCDMPMFRNDWEWEYTETPYCPNCGAKMDEVTE